MTITTFDDLQREVFRLHAEKQYTAALDLIRREASRFPEMAHRTRYWEMCFSALDGDTQWALKMFKSALTQRFWFGELMLRNDPDLVALQGNPEFEYLVTRDAELQAKAQTDARPQRLVREPGVDTVQPYPVVLALHGAGGTAADNIDFWTPAARLGWLVVTPQSSHMTGYGRFGWRDNVQAAGEIRDHLHELGAQYPLDPARVVLGGFSQGGWAAAEMALRGDIPAAGVIAVAPGTPLPERWGDLVASSTAKQTRFVLIIGDQDTRFFPQTTALHDLLRANGFTSHLRVCAGLDHAYPPDFATLLSDSLRNVIPNRPS